MAEVTRDKSQAAELDAFEAMLRPHLARLIDTYGEFTDRLDKHDREYFLLTAMQWLFEHRLEINSATAISRLWVTALEFTSRLRASWRIDVSFAGVKTGEKWIRPTQLRRTS